LKIGGYVIKLLILFLWKVPVRMFRIWRDTVKWDREMRKFMRDIRRKGS